MQNYDSEILCKILDGMSLDQRREWIVKMLLASIGKDSAQVARKHRITPAAISAALKGKNNMTWTPRIVKALEAETEQDLTFLLTDKELKKIGRACK